MNPNNLADPEWRLNNLYFIKDKNGKRIRFVMNWAQRAMFQGLWYLNIVLKARQLGITTFIQLLMLDRCLFNDNTNAGVIAHTKDDAEAFFDDKIKFAYDNLPADLRAELRADTSNTRELSFTNGSKIRVGTSMRSGTLQYLHVSEFGKICAQYPDKAKEIVSGALNTVAAGNFIFIESTAEGSHGRFFDMCQTAMKMADAVAAGMLRLTKMDYKFFFFPWWKHPEYTLEGEQVVIPPHLVEYFEQLRQEEGINLTAEQMAWYVKKERTEQDTMKQEYPSTPQEAFEKMLKGVIFAEQLRKAKKEHRITELPHERGVPVNTFWDLGRNDTNSIWFHQRVGAWDHFIRYYEHRLVDITHYIEVMEELAHDHGWLWGVMYLPHDGKTRHIEAVAGSVEDILRDSGYRVEVVNRPLQKNLSIEPTRRAFSHCRFDAVACEEGIRTLEGYVWTWDDTHETYRKTPAHNWASNGADAFQTFGFGYKGEQGSFSQQLHKLDGTGGRKYLQNRRVHNPITNPDYSHVV